MNLYKHDCDECTFLGNFDYDERSYDLYYHLDEGVLPTVFARWSNYDGHCESGWNLEGIVMSPPIQEAYNRSIELKLYG